MKIDQRWPENGMRKCQVIFDPILKIRAGLQQKETIGKAANKVLSGETHFRLPDKEWDAFCNVLCKFLNLIIHSIKRRGGVKILSVGFFTAFSESQNPYNLFLVIYIV